MSPSAAPPLQRHALRLLLPPSLGEEWMAKRSQHLESFLTRASGHRVDLVVAASYEVLAKDLLAGRADAAWAPPFVCARVESMGARVLVRGVRGGVSSYRAALLCREDKPLTLESLAGTRAAWVDKDSVGGYLLPLALLKARGLDPAKTFFHQDFVGSYRAALDAVASGAADVASIFAPSHHEGRPDETGVSQVAPELASRFRVVAFTEEAPSDGVVSSPASDPQAMIGLEKVLLTLHDSSEGAALLQEVFQAERFEPAPRLGYRALYRVALATI